MSKFLRNFLLLTALLLCVLLAAACGNDNPTTTDPAGSSTPSASDTDPAGSTPFSTTPAADPDMSTPPAPTTEAPPAQLYEEKTVPSDGRVTLPSTAYISGTLLSIGSNHPYRFNTPALIRVADIADNVKKIDAQNLMLLYGNKSKDYLLSNSKIFLKSDAFPYLEALMAAFRGATGKSTVQVVNGYLYSDTTSLTSAFVTGYAVALNLYEDGVTYSLGSEAKKVTVDGKTMTCLEWFQENCARYGFVYTGLTGNENSPLATFRFVGVPHALFMQEHDMIDPSAYSDYVKSASSEIKVEDAAGAVWTIAYFKASTDSANTVLTLPAGAVYTVSGNNTDGFLVAYRTAS